MVFTKGTDVNHTAWEAGGQRQGKHALLGAGLGCFGGLAAQGEQFYAISARIVNVNQYSSAIEHERQ